MIKKLTLLAAVFAVSACSITQDIEPAHISKGSEICIIENTDVREGFLKEFKSALSNRNVPHRVVKPSNVPTSCEWTAKYVAKWSWDLSLYMSYAEIKIYHKGQLDGEAVYDSTGGSANTAKFIDAEPKIRELVDQLIQIKLSTLFFRAFG